MTTPTWAINPASSTSKIASRSYSARIAPRRTRTRSLAGPRRSASGSETGCDITSSSRPDTTRDERVRSTLSRVASRKPRSASAPRRGSWSIHQCPRPSRIATSAPNRSADRRASTSPPVYWSAVAITTSPGRRSACSRSRPHSVIAGWAADRYSARMHRPISGPAAIAQALAASGVIPASTKPATRSSIGIEFIASTNASPSPGVCQTCARSCHTYSGSAQPAMSEHHDRIRSGRVAATRCTWPPPQSWPIRSIGPAMFSSSPTSHAT